MKWLMPLLLLASVARADDLPRDVPTEADFGKLLDALDKHSKNSNEGLRGEKLVRDEQWSVRPDFGLAKDPLGKRYLIWGQFASFVFWRVTNPDAEQQRTMEEDFARLKRQIRARFEGWKKQEGGGLLGMGTRFGTRSRKMHVAPEIELWLTKTKGVWSLTLRFAAMNPPKPYILPHPSAQQIAATYGKEPHARDIPTRENFGALLDALAAGRADRFEKLKIVRRPAGVRSMKPGFGLAADPEAKRYRFYDDLYSERASFVFWASKDVQFAEVQKEFAWMARVTRERYKGWAVEEQKSKWAQAITFDAPEGAGSATVYLAATPKGLLVLGLLVRTEQRPSRNARWEVLPQMIVDALKKAARSKWSEMRWAGNGLIGPAALRRTDVILAHNNTLVSQRGVPSMAEELHQAVREGKPFEFTVRRGAVKKVSFRVEPSFGKYEGRLDGKVPSGPGRRTLHSGTLVIANYKQGWAQGPGIAIGRNGYASRVWYGLGKPGERTPLATWKGKTLDGYEYGPIVLERGEVLGKTGNRHTLRIKRLGVFIGTFVDGIAQGEGLVKRPSGDLLKVDCIHGIMSVTQVLKVVGPERMAIYNERLKAAKGKVFFRGELLSGEARNGNGVLFLSWGYLYRGALRDGQPHGAGRFESANGSYTSGTYKNGKRHGRIRSVWVRNGMVTSDRTDTYKDGKYVLPPDKRRPPPARRSAPRQFSECWTCSMRGYVYVTTWTVEGVTFSPFMPGDRHYGSWIWKGYKNTSNARRVKHTKLVTCRACGGTGKRR